jgi:hypothetical protein
METPAFLPGSGRPIFPGRFVIFTVALTRRLFARPQPSPTAGAGQAVRRVVMDALLPGLAVRGDYQGLGPRS